MNLQNISGEDDRFVRTYEYGDGDVVAVDLGTPDASVDVVGDTVIVVEGDGNQFELELPGQTDAQAFINNGILTIEVKGQ